MAATFKTFAVVPRILEKLSSEAYIRGMISTTSLICSVIAQYYAGMLCLISKLSKKLYANINTKRNALSSSSALYSKYKNKQKLDEDEKARTATDSILRADYRTV
uniref:Uncharacterized protein n=1 Tax=Glossina pallidipes TaxID=7398 RepID=A0A1A9Z461_GLOPL